MVFKGLYCLLPLARRLSFAASAVLLFGWLFSGVGAAASENSLGKLPGKRLLELCRAAEGKDAADLVAQADARICLAFIDGFV